MIKKILIGCGIFFVVLMIIGGLASEDTTLEPAESTPSEPIVSIHAPVMDAISSFKREQAIRKVSIHAPVMDAMKTLPYQGIV